MSQVQIQENVTSDAEAWNAEREALAEFLLHRFVNPWPCFYRAIKPFDGKQLYFELVQREIGLTDLHKHVQSRRGKDLLLVSPVSLSRTTKWLRLVTPSLDPVSTLASAAFAFHVEQRVSECSIECLRLCRGTLVEWYILFDEPVPSTWAWVMGKRLVGRMPAIFGAEIWPNPDAPSLAKRPGPYGKLPLMGRHLQQSEWTQVMTPHGLVSGAAAIRHILACKANSPKAIAKRLGIPSPR